jgi:hypothetical protein
MAVVFMVADWAQQARAAGAAHPVLGIAVLLGALAGVVYCVYCLDPNVGRFPQLAASQRLIREGQVLEGEVVESTGEDRASGTGECVDYWYTVLVSYRFRTPSGQEIRGRVMEERDVQDKFLPAPGTPVRVLHLDSDGTFVLL